MKLIIFYIFNNGKWLLKNSYNLYVYIMFNKYYQANKEKLRKKVHCRYQNLSEEEKEKGQKMAWDRYKNLPQEDKSPFKFFEFYFFEFCPRFKSVPHSPIPHYLMVMFFLFNIKKWSVFLCTSSIENFP